MNGSAGDAPAPSTIPAPERREVSLTNLDKVFWPGKDYRKGDLLSYYRGVAPWLLPYLRDRPLVLTRFPDGIDGKSFFQKDAPVWSPDWVRTVRVFSEDAGRDIDYFICDSVESLLFIINLGTIPLHVWASRVQDPSRPDWTIIDLDPKGASFANVIRLALAAKKLCEEVGLPSFLKTSGASGLHVLVPLGGQTTFEQGRILAHILSQLLVSRHPDIATLERVIGKRQGKVYLDYLQNGHGKLLVAPFSARPVPEASVSMPLAWDAIESLESPARFELRSAVPHLEAHGDPMATILTLRPDLGGALQKLLALAT